MSESPGGSPIEVREDRERQGLGVFATRAIAPGERLGFFSGEESPARSRMSLQFGEVIVEPAPDEPLRHLNHACEPTAAFGGRNGRELFAARALAAGEAVTIDYNAHEDELSEPFACRCGSARCPGEIRGRHVVAATPILRKAVIAYLVAGIAIALWQVWAGPGAPLWIGFTTERLWRFLGFGLALVNLFALFPSGNRRHILGNLGLLLLAGVLVPIIAGFRP
jgi:hypothetical protein